MTVKTTGAEFKRFYFDDAYWPDGTWHEDEEIEVYGLRTSEDIAIEDIPDTASMRISAGMVMNIRCLKDGKRNITFTACTATYDCKRKH